MFPIVMIGGGFVLFWAIITAFWIIKVGDDRLDPKEADSAR